MNSIFAIQILQCIGSDMSVEEQEKTAQRAARAMKYLTKGYEDSIESALGDGVFTEDHNEMVVVKDIDMCSMCEHHLLPFYGTVSVGYMPNGKILGLEQNSKVGFVEDAPL